jgi:hypothetical protein
MVVFVELGTWNLELGTWNLELGTVPEFQVSSSRFQDQ